ncbi:MAG: hypothetical protein QXU81_00195 [Candidatus Bathyarchaeia archaeon]
MGRRYKIKKRPRHYVVRDRRGRFKDWVGIGRSVRADKRRKVSQKRSEPGYGHIQDYER